MKGTVKFFNVKKGFGFIKGEDDKEYFVHITGLSQGVRLNENDEVSFEVEQGERGPKAVKVSKGGQAPAQSSNESEDADDAYDDEMDDEYDDQ